ncbi:paraquat-inducible protein A [Limibacillus sp. MBR-115]|uniref:paraquat-inducible protein A n=1 Tax=Limibacillus sp. MBR-115 TaxID=3156465 RepID=UPI003396AC6A
MTDKVSPPDDPPSLASCAAGLDKLLGPVLLLSGVLLAFGWTLPMMTVSRFVFLSEEVSILRAIGQLWDADEIFLFLIIATFSVVFPALKVGIGLLLWYRSRHAIRRRRWLAGLEMLGRWSMLDVFVVALIVVAIQISLIDDVALHAGLYVFTAAILLSMLALRRMETLAQRLDRTQSKG